jgi:hypothetical protein
LIDVNDTHIKVMSDKTIQEQIEARTRRASVVGRRMDTAVMRILPGSGENPETLIHINSPGPEWNENQAVLTSRARISYPLHAGTGLPGTIRISRIFSAGSAHMMITI